MKKALAILLTAVMLLGVLTACGSKKDDAADDTQNTEDTDKAAADNVAALIDAIYVQERTDETDAQCEAAKAAWDALTDEQKSMVEGEEASPEYFGLDTGDASKDDPRNQDDIGENELLVVSFGTSYNDSRVNDIKSIEDALQEAYPDWSVRRAFTAQIIINHIQARDGEKIDNMTQALDRAVANGVKNLVVQPTHLMHGAEYDEMCEAIEQYKDKFESVSIAEPLLGEVGSDATVINADKEAVAKAITAAAVADAGFESLDAAKDAGTAFVFMGHGTAHVAKVSYSQMSAQMQNLGYENVFIGTVEGEPEDTSCESVIEAVKGMLGTTFGGNHLACAAAIAVLDVMAEEHLVENAAETGHYLLERLAEMAKDSDEITDVRGRGLMIGIEIKGDASALRKKLLFEGKIFTGGAGAHTVRLLPALGLTIEQADTFLETFKKYIG